MDEIKKKAHYISITGIVRKDGKYLIVKRGDGEKLFPGKWCVPGGKVEQGDFLAREKDTSSHWLDVFERVLEREIEEEVGLKIKGIGYVSNLALVRPNGFSTFIVSMYADHDEGDVKLDGEELVDYKWVSLDELKDYDLIENIYEQVVKVDSLYNKG